MDGLEGQPHRYSFSVQLYDPASVDTEIGARQFRRAFAAPPGQRGEVSDAAGDVSAAAAAKHPRRCCCIECRSGQRGTAASAAFAVVVAKHLRLCCCIECRPGHRGTA